MNTVKRDRETLKRLVESYGKQDVLKYVNHIDEVVKQRVPYILGGTQWGEDFYDENDNFYRGDYRTNPAYLARITNSDDVPDNVMDALYNVVRYGDIIYDIAYNNVPAENCKYQFLRELSPKTARIIYKEVNPIIGLFSNKTNIKDDDYRIMPEDLIDILPNLKNIAAWDLGLFSNFARTVANAVEGYKREKKW